MAAVLLTRRAGHRHVYVHRSGHLGIQKKAKGEASGGNAPAGTLAGDSGPMSLEEIMPRAFLSEAGTADEQELSKQS